VGIRFSISPHPLEVGRFGQTKPALHPDALGNFSLSNQAISARFKPMATLRSLLIGSTVPVDPLDVPVHFHS
jgi:hypothetical protein